MIQNILKWTFYYLKNRAKFQFLKKKFKMNLMVFFKYIVKIGKTKVVEDQEYYLKLQRLIKSSVIS